jgi:hypothetical protein
MNTTRNILAGAASVAAILALATSASAQTAGNTSTASISVTGNVIAPLTLTAGTAMRFGTVIRPRTGSSTVTLAPGGGLTFSGTAGDGTAAMTAPGSGAIGPGTFTVNGDPARTYTITPTFSVTGTGVTAVAYDTAVDMTSTGGSVGTLPATGTDGVASQTLNAGGRIAVSSTATGAIGGSLTLVVNYQ